MTTRLATLLDAVTRVPGVRGALLVSADDGLAVAEALMEGVKGNALAALSASLVKRFQRAAEAGGAGTLNFLHLQAADGVVLAVPAPHDMLLITVADAGVNVGLARLEMLRAVERVR